MTGRSLGLERVRERWSRAFALSVLPGFARPFSPFALPCLGLVASSLFFLGLGLPLLEPEEARYAEIPRQMLATGNVLTPVLYDQPYYQKPPLLYWLVMASYSVFGVHDWAARLVPALASVLVVLVTYGWGRRTVGPGAALAAGLVLCLAPRFLYFGRMVVIDSLLCLWVTAALATAHISLTRPVWTWRGWLLSAMLCGLGVLTKGPVALALVLPPLLLLSVVDRRCPRLTILRCLLYGLTACAVAAPWFVLAALREPDAVRDFFWLHNFQRFTAAFDHQQPWWYYLPGLLLGLGPSLVLIWPMGQRWRQGGTWPAAMGFFLLAAMWMVLFFSLSGCKRATYLLPVWPPLTLALGTGLVQLWCEGRLSSVWPQTMTLAALGAALVIVVGGTVSQLWLPTKALLWTGGLVCLLLLFLWQKSRLGVTWSWVAAGCLWFFILLVGTGQLLPDYHRRFSLRGQLRRHLVLASDPDVGVVCYPRRYDSLGFYLQRSSIQVFAAEERDNLVAAFMARPRTLLLVKGEQALKKVLGAMPPELEYQTFGRQGKLAVGLVQRRPAIRH